MVSDTALCFGKIMFIIRNNFERNSSTRTLTRGRHRVLNLMGPDASGHVPFRHAESLGFGPSLGRSKNQSTDALSRIRTAANPEIYHQPERANVAHPQERPFFTPRSL